MAGVDAKSLTMTEEQVKSLIGGLTGTISAAVMESIGKQMAEKAPTEESPNREKNHEQRLTEKSYKRMEKFSGGESAWEDWKYDFTIITRSVNPDVARALDLCSKSKKPVSAANLANIPLELKAQSKTWDPSKRSTELFELLIMLTSDEAKSLIKTSTEDGFVAWHILNSTYSRRTLAKTLRCYREASNPETAQNSTEVLTKISN